MSPDGRHKPKHPASAMSRPGPCWSTTRLTPLSSETKDSSSSAAAPCVVGDSWSDHRGPKSFPATTTTTTWRRRQRHDKRTPAARGGALVVVVVTIFAFLVTPGRGDLQPTFARCCALGTNWARERRTCAAFPAPVPAISSEHQAICITASTICCTRLYRDRQCQEGMQAAQSGQECPTRTQTGGSYFQDCCDGCKLGLVSGNMAMGCALSDFQFGFPWDNAYLHCCRSSSPPGSIPALDLTPTAPTLSSALPGAGVGAPSNTMLPLYPDGATLPPEENLCLRFPGQLCGHVCVPTPGSYRCQCRAGFTLTADGKTCIQDSVTDRCQENNPCEHICMDTGVSIECSCRQGFQLGRDERSCTDIDECQLGVHACTPGEQVCYNQEGAYACVNNDGRLSLPGRASLDLQGPNSVIPGFGSLGVQGFPVNPPVGGGREASAFAVDGRCPPGYNFNLDTRFCDDVDECLASPGLCGRIYSCHNTIGSYTCTRLPFTDCPHGFTFDTSLQTCLDVDECAEETDGCDRSVEFCVNKHGSFECQPRGASSTECPAGYKYNAHLLTCEDVDECEENLDGCDPEEEVCRNTVGAYKCDMRCDQGFSFSLAFHTCVDVDECVEKLHACDPDNELCINEIGQYRCESIVNFNDVDFRVSNDVRPFGGGAARGGDHRDGITGLTHTTFPRTNGTVHGCPDGFGFDLATRQCLDVNECTAGLHNCTRGTERCINTLGGFTCTSLQRCRAGYTGIAGNCQDIDECAGSVARCLPGQICVNTPGAFECRVECQDGFKYDPTDVAVCVDVDECRTSSPCGLDQLCVNTEGSYYCSPATTSTTTTTTTTTRATTSTVPLITSTETPSTTASTTTRVTTTTTEAPPCPPGYQRDHRTQSCRDIDECAEGFHDCRVDEQRCVNSPGAYRCAWLPCDPGLRRNEQTHICVDIDECAEERSTCRPRVEECVNTPGSFMCQPRHCPTGYTREAATGQCVDVDECQEGTPCSSNEICVNTAGSYHCNSSECQQGYERTQPDGPCRDVNECETGRHSCRGPSEECVNTEGGHRCRVLPSCPTGFFRHRTSRRCADVDECATGDHDCAGGERCINMHGGFLCRATPDSCTKGFRYNVTSRRCQDVDECAENSDSCDWSTQTCVNSDGSFQCLSRVPTCSLGYRFDEEKRTCVDIDECEEGTDDCVGDRYCVNTLGSYQCQGPEDASQQCQPGYAFNRTARACLDIDECSEGRHDCWPEVCVNRRGTYSCRPRDDGDDDVEQQQRQETSREEPPQEKEEDVGKRVEEESSRSRSGGEGGLGGSGVEVGGGGGVRGRDRCSPGFRWHRRRRTCVDVDECAHDDLYLCSAGEMCVNVRGGYECVPAPTRASTAAAASTLSSLASTPPSLTTTTTRVQDASPSTENTRVVSDVTGSGQLVPGGGGGGSTLAFTPPPPPPLPPPPSSDGCLDGFVYSPAFRSCRDVDECESNPCDANERCRNTQGSFSCECRDGFRKNDLTGDCEDVNECQLGLHTCRASQRCDNSVGSYTCVRVAGCGTGYTLNHNTGQCEDDDECKLGKDDCHQLGPRWRCVNTRGSFRCEKKKCRPFEVLAANGTCLNTTCPTGFKIGPLGCIDINECEGRPCRRNERCLNTRGSYQCLARLDCSAGYHMNELGTQCIDIDECQLGTHKCQGLQQCVNRLGGYVCQCPPGYRTSANRVCEDIDECNSYFGSVCSSNAHCENLPGSYRCNCKEGFQDAGDGRTCDDVDECKEVPGVCNHQCFNMWGSYRCTCNKGYRLGNDSRSCEDVDECSEYRGRGSLCIGLCVNTPGSFKCDCPEGYTLGADGRTCQDVNECETAGTCRGPNELCVNTRGGHVCRELTCPAGYARDSQHRNLRREGSVICNKRCVAGDLRCERNTTQTITYKFLGLPTIRRVPKPISLTTIRLVGSGEQWHDITSRLSILRGNDAGCFDVRRNTRQGWLQLVAPVIGPIEYHLLLLIQVFSRGVRSREHLAHVSVIVAQYDF